MTAGANSVPADKPPSRRDIVHAEDIRAAQQCDSVIFLSVTVREPLVCDSDENGSAQYGEIPQMLQQLNVLLLRLGEAETRVEHPVSYAQTLRGR